MMIQWVTCGYTGLHEDTLGYVRDTLGYTGLHVDTVGYMRIY